MALHGEGIAGVVFLALYTVNLGILIYGYATRRIVFKSVFTFLLFHVCLRLASQAVAIALGARQELDTGLLIAYFVLGAEGYFSLVLCAYRFLIHHHQHTYPISGSWLEGRNTSTDPWWKRVKHSMTASDAAGHSSPWVMTWIHWTLIGANTVIIVGGTRTTGADITDANYESLVREGNDMRTAGQAIFLFLCILLGVFLAWSRRQDRSPRGTLPPRSTRLLRVATTHGEADVDSAGPGRDGRRLDGYHGRVHPTLLVLCCAWPPLIVRGIFGVLQSQVRPINYATPGAYDAHGFTTLFVALENVLAVLPEWTGCCLLCAAMFTRDSFNPEHLARDEARFDDDGKAERISSHA